MSENDGKVHTIYMKTRWKLSRKISHTKNPIYMGKSAGASLGADRKSSVHFGGQWNVRDFQGYSPRSKFGPHIFFSPLESSLTSYNPGKRCGGFFLVFFPSEVKITCFSFLAYFSLSFIWHRRMPAKKNSGRTFIFFRRHCDGVI